MNIFVVKKGNTLIPAFPDDEERMNKFKDGEALSVRIKKAHSVRQHRAVFAIARTVLDNAPEDDSVLGVWGRWYKSNPEKTTYNFVKACEMQLGFFDIVVNKDGTFSTIPQSISYENMDKEEFNMFFNAYINHCAELLGVSPDELLDNYKEGI